MVTVVRLFGLDGCEVVAVFVGAAVVEPVHPFGGGDLEVVDALPWPSRLDQLGLVKAVDRFGECVVIGQADGAGRGLIPATSRCSE